MESKENNPIQDALDKLTKDLYSMKATVASIYEGLKKEPVKQKEEYTASTLKTELVEIILSAHTKGIPVEEVYGILSQLKHTYACLMSLDIKKSIDAQLKERLKDAASTVRKATTDIQSSNPDKN